MGSKHSATAIYSVLLAYFVCALGSAAGAQQEFEGITTEYDTAARSLADSVQKGRISLTSIEREASLTERSEVSGAWRHAWYPGHRRDLQQQCACRPGRAGPMGPMGTYGPRGPRGKGPPGPLGPSEGGGPRGPTGVRGPRGVTGPATGPRGAQGAKGLVGARGPVGGTGPVGERGPRGPAGVVGSVGRCAEPCNPVPIVQEVVSTFLSQGGGNKGATGPTGPTGASVNRTGTFTAGVNGTVQAVRQSKVIVNDTGADIDFIDTRTNGWNRTIYNVLGYRCKAVYNGTNTTEKVGKGGRANMTAIETTIAKFPAACYVDDGSVPVVGNTTRRTPGLALIGGGCQLKCVNDTDYARLFLVRNFVVHGDIPYNDNATNGIPLGFGSGVECGIRYTTRGAAVDNCTLTAIPYCCLGIT